MDLSLKEHAKPLLSIKLVNVLLAKESHVAKPRANTEGDSVRAGILETWFIGEAHVNSLSKKACLKSHVW